MSKRIAKVFGQVLYGLIGKRLPEAHCRLKPLGVFSKKFRQFCGKLILQKCGSNVNIYPRAVFSSKVELGNNADIGKYAKITGKVVIGDNVIMGPECQIWTRNHCTSRTDIAIKYQGTTEEKPVYIGEGTWIGSRVTILPGVHIGRDCVIGAGAVVANDIPDFAVAVGNPCLVIKFRK